MCTSHHYVLAALSHPRRSMALAFLRVDYSSNVQEQECADRHEPIRTEGNSISRNVLFHVRLYVFHSDINLSDLNGGENFNIVRSNNEPILNAFSAAIA